MAGSSAPDARRVRENQRRARVRRKELLQDMRDKLQEYERAGAQANVHMQQAARRVALENARLRLLLHRNGVTSEQTNAFLRSFEDGNEATPTQGLSSGTSVRGPLPRRQDGEDTVKGASVTPARTTACCASTSSPPDTEDQRRSYHSADFSLPEDRLGLLSMAIEMQGAEETAQHLAYSAAERKPPEAPVSSEPPPHSPNEMHCDAAVQLIADMHGRSDRDSIKQAMGCAGGCECSIKNTELFRIMENHYNL